MICNQYIDKLNTCSEKTGSFTAKEELIVYNCDINQGFADCQQANCKNDDIPVFPVTSDNLIWLQTNFLDFKNNQTEKFCSKYLKLDKGSNQFVRFTHQNQYLIDDDITIELIFRIRNLNQKTYLITKRRKTGNGGLVQPHGNSPSFSVWVNGNGKINVEWVNSYLPNEKLHFQTSNSIFTNQIIHLTIIKKKLAYNETGFSVRVFNVPSTLNVITSNLNVNQYRLFENRDVAGNSRQYDPNTGLPVLNGLPIINDGDWILGSWIECNDLSSATASGNLDTSNIDLMGFNLYKRELTFNEINNNVDITLLQCPSKVNVYTDNILNATFNHDGGNQVLDYSFYANHALLPFTNSINLPTNTATSCNCPCLTSITFGWTNNELNVTKDAWQDYDETTNCCNELNCYQIEAVERICELDENISRLEFTFQDNLNYYDGNQVINGVRDKGLYLSLQGNCSEYNFFTLPIQLKLSNYVDFNSFLNGVLLYYQTLFATWGGTSVVRIGDTLRFDFDINWIRKNLGYEICNQKPKICQLNPNSNCSSLKQFHFNIVSDGFDLYSIQIGSCLTINIPPGCVQNNTDLYNYLTGSLAIPCNYTPPASMVVTQSPVDGSIRIELDLDDNCCGDVVSFTGEEDLIAHATTIFCCVSSTCNQFPGFRQFIWELDPLATIYYNDITKNGCVKISASKCEDQFPCFEGGVCVADYTNYTDFLNAITDWIKINISPYTSVNLVTGWITSYLPTEFCDAQLTVCRSGCYDDSECNCVTCQLHFGIYIFGSDPPFGPCTLTITNDCLGRGDYLMQVTFNSDPSIATTVLNLYNALVLAYPTATVILTGAVFNYQIEIYIDCPAGCTCSNSNNFYFFFDCNVYATPFTLICNIIPPIGCPCVAYYEFSFHNYNPAEVYTNQTFNLQKFCFGVWQTIMSVSVTIQPTLYDTLLLLRDQLAQNYPAFSWMVSDDNKIYMIGDCSLWACVAGPSTTYPDFNEVRVIGTSDITVTNEYWEIRENSGCTPYPQILPFRLVNSTSCCYIIEDVVTLVNQNDLTIIQPTLNPLCCPQQLGVAGLQDCCCNPLDSVLKPTIICQNNFRTGDPETPFSQNIWIDVSNLPTSLDRFSFKIISNTGQEYNSFCYEKNISCKNVVRICAEFTCGIDLIGKYRGKVDEFCGCDEKWSNDCIEIYAEFQLEKTEYSFEDEYNISKTFYRLISNPMSINQYNEVMNYILQDKIYVNGLELELEGNQSQDIQGRKDIIIDLLLKTPDATYEDTCTDCYKFKLKNDLDDIGI